MKKRCLLLVYIFTMIVLIVGCENNKQTLTELSITDIINNKITFITENGNSVYLKDYRLPNLYEDLYLIPEKYVFVDFDGDNVQELVLHAPNVGRYIVFHRKEKDIYAFEFVERVLISLKIDGSFIQSEGAGINAYARLTFDENGYDIFEEAYSNDIDNVYEINEKESTSEKVNNYKQKYEKKESVNWKEISD